MTPKFVASHVESNTKGIYRRLRKLEEMAASVEYVDNLESRLREQELHDECDKCIDTKALIKALMPMLHEMVGEALGRRDPSSVVFLHFNDRLRALEEMHGITPFGTTYGGHLHEKNR